MIKLRTEVERQSLKQQIAPGDSLFLIGSCFTDHIGSWLKDMWLPVTCNPWGVLFNPASIAMSLSRAASFHADGYRPELHLRDGLFHSFDHHGSFSMNDEAEMTARIVDCETKAADALSAARHVVVTLGTAWVYERDSHVVANCHKFPASEFTRRMLSVDEIVGCFSPLISDRHWVFTVSPIRHVRDGLHANQLSKATLLLAIDRLQQLFPSQVEYLPAYELLIDDLRDYRFYADDLVHPSQLGVEMVRQLVTDCCFSAAMKQYVAEATSIRKALDHRPSDPDSPQHRAFVAQTLARRDQLLHSAGLTACVQQRNL
ncbi:MAG: GSCFA domain-containing protein [Bacteroidales bacterium]|nr:GSCFA domain-containing protein [Candidatus Liminaster caballi]